MTTPTGTADPAALADSASRWTALLVFALGVLLIVGPALSHGEKVFGDPYGADTQTTVVTTADGNQKVQKVVTTTKPGSPSLLERGLGRGGLLLLRLGLAGLAAFLAAAIVQRVLRAHYAFKAGQFELPDLGEAVQASGEAIVKLTQRVDSLSGEIIAQRSHTADALRTAAEGVGQLAALTRKTDDLDARLSRLEP